MAKEKTIKYLTELMATVQMAYFKGRLGERNTETTGGDGAICGELWVHEKEHGDADIAIDLYRFGGDGKPVCDGLQPCTVTFDDGTESTGWLYCMFYDPDDVTPLSFAFDQYNGPDISIDPDCVPEDVLKNVTAWLDGVFPNNDGKRLFNVGDTVLCYSCERHRKERRPRDKEHFSGIITEINNNIATVRNGEGHNMYYDICCIEKK